MFGNKNSLTLRPKKEFYTKEELSNYIDLQINNLKQINPILENTYLIKIESSKLNSWLDYFASVDCFVADVNDLLLEPNMVIWPKVVKNRIQVYIALQTQNSKQNKEFLENLVIDYVWPFPQTKFKIQKIKNLSILIENFKSIKNKNNNSKSNLTKYSKKYEIILNFFDYAETIEEAKQKLYNQLYKIKKFEKRYKGEN